MAIVMSGPGARGPIVCLKQFIIVEIDSLAPGVQFSIAYQRQYLLRYILKREYKLLWC